MTAPVQPTEPLTFEAWWDSDPERKRFHPMSIARMAWQAASAQAPVQPTEPDAWLVYVEKHDISYVVLDTDDADLVDDCTNHGGVVTPLYAHPPLQPTEQTIEQRNRAVCALYDHPPAQPEELERLRGIIRTLWTNQDPYEWQDDFVAEVNAAIAAPPVQPMEPVAWFWFDPEDGGEWKHVADNAEDAAAYGTQAVPLCRCAHPPVQPTEPK